MRVIVHWELHPRNMTPVTESNPQGTLFKITVSHDNNFACMLRERTSSKGSLVMVVLPPNFHSKLYKICGIEECISDTLTFLARCNTFRPVQTSLLCDGPPVMAQCSFRDCLTIC